MKKIEVLPKVWRKVWFYAVMVENVTVKNRISITKVIADFSLLILI